ncbi:MAG: hypothetical protein P8X95_09645 [Anaerolineales bacterium]
MLDRKGFNGPSVGKRSARKILIVILICFLFGLVVLDRVAWASISQWREDQATNLWLGYTRNPLDLPVGLVSSVDVPNPNGLPLLAIPLSRLPGLLSISTFLGIVQAALIIWVVWLVFGITRPALITLGPLLTSVFLGAISVEFWGQWLMVSVDLLFFGLSLSYLRRPSVKLLPLMLLVVLLPPALYLAGFVNALVFALIFLLLVLFKRSQGSIMGWILSAATSLAILVASLGLTWLPYFRTVERGQITAIFAGKSSWTGKLSASAHAMLRFPHWSVLQWSQDTLAPIYQSSSKILPDSATSLLAFLRVFQSVAVLLALASLAWFLVSPRRSPGAVDSRSPASLPIAAWIIALAFSLLACALSPFLGGPDWTRSKRPDQSIQILPFLLFMWFSAPFVFKRASGRFFGWAAAALSFLVVGANLILGYQVIASHLNYRGDYLSEADVPLVQKIRAVDFIAQDWLGTSGSRTIPVYYDLEGQWPWINDMGDSMNQWYPAPMTFGRGFDYQLLRKYGLTNSQEGVQIRSEDQAVYIVAYVFEHQSVDPPSCQHVFGRLLVLKDCSP